MSSANFGCSKQIFALWLVVPPKILQCTMKHPVFKSEVRDKTKALLAEYLKYKENTFAKISKDTGLSENWLSMFARNKLKHTDIGRVETLYNYLSPLRLEA